MKKLTCSILALIFASPVPLIWAQNKTANTPNAAKARDGSPPTGMSCL